MQGSVSWAVSLEFAQLIGIVGSICALRVVRGQADVVVVLWEPFLRPLALSAPHSPGKLGEACHNAPRLWEHLLSTELLGNASV
jgi:hypothetical protein